MTFADAVALYGRIHVPTLRDATADYVERELASAATRWPGRTLDSISRRDVLDMVDQASAERGPHAANMVLKCVNALFRFCEARDLMTMSPGRGVRPVKVKSRDRVLSDDELAVVWRAAMASADVPAGRLVRLLILTGCRRQEMAGLRWDEVERYTIELPASRTKTGMAHSVWMTAPVRRIIEECAGVATAGWAPGRGVVGRNSLYVLTGDDRPVSNGGDVKKAIATPDLPHWTFHDLRRSFATGAARIGIPIQVVEKMLNHKLKGVLGVYQKYDLEKERRNALNRWARHVMRLVNQEG